MSPLIFSLPVMYAEVAFCSPLRMRWKFSSVAEIVQSASPSPSRTLTVPSSTVTSHMPAPSMSKRYVLLTPPIFDASTRAASDSKNSRAVSAMCSTLLRERDFGFERAVPAGRRQQEGQQQASDRRSRGDVERGLEVDCVRDRAQPDRGDAAETDREAGRQARGHADRA